MLKHTTIEQLIEGFGKKFGCIQFQDLKIKRMSQSFIKLLRLNEFIIVIVI